jgi:hypothetical protein
MKRWAAWALATITVAGSVVAAAANLPLTSEGVAAGNAPVAPCDANGFSPTYTTVGGNVTTVAVGGIADPACEGGALEVTLVGAGGKLGSGGPVTIPTDGDSIDNSVSVSLSPQPDGELVTGIRVLIAGP